jgi:hypothetical protein
MNSVWTTRAINPWRHPWCQQEQGLQVTTDIVVTSPCRDWIINGLLVIALLLPEKHGYSSRWLRCNQVINSCKLVISLNVWWMLASCWLMAIVELKFSLWYQKRHKRKKIGEIIVRLAFLHSILLETNRKKEKRFINQNETELWISDQLKTITSSVQTQNRVKSWVNQKSN